MRNKYIKFLFFLIGLPLISFSQTSQGFAFDNYSGIYGTVANPANSVDSKYEYHINVLSYNQMGISDIGALPNFEVETAPNGFNGLEFSTNLTHGENDGYSFGHTDVLLPSVTWDFHDRFAVGLLLRSRTFFDYNNVGSSLLRGANQGFSTLEQGFDHENSDLNSTFHSWKEAGLNVSAVLLDGNFHFFKLGGTFKYYVGNGAVETRGSLSSSYDGNALTLNTGVDAPLIVLNSFQEQADEDSSKLFIQESFNFQNNGSGYGGDIGMVYEWRPRETNRVDVRSNSGAVNKYKLKISASVLDMGTIKYAEIQQDTISVNNLVINSNSYDVTNGLIGTIMDSEGEEVTINPARGDVSVALPMSAHLNLDYLFKNNYYINFNYIKGLTSVSDNYANTQPDLITVTPRYETRKFSAYLPINFNQKAGIFAGLGLRYGPVTVGSMALSSILTEGKVTHLYVGVSIPFMKELYR
ncbi:hypothetical protein J0X14_14600 [Muricauda sp. CAU 1633]|uniref:DUF5723 family protein n=1 Tax=Allomuricauda sp. CAU 1633 TaxID=2816036 RepID=UPI001A8ECB69|nr:DUF5723 family protein [Muricauda sp. CAU 1633]MBO0323536.1 hypothetical protein [Muricauda sp. CAU 1633]